MLKPHQIVELIGVVAADIKGGGEVYKAIQYTKRGEVKPQEQEAPKQQHEWETLKKRFDQERQRAADAEAVIHEAYRRINPFEPAASILEGYVKGAMLKTDRERAALRVHELASQCCEEDKKKLKAQVEVHAGLLSKIHKLVIGEG